VTFTALAIAQRSAAEQAGHVGRIFGRRSTAGGL
jgi:hypothetical protein